MADSATFNHSDTLLAAQNQMLELALRDAPLEEILDGLILSVEQSSPVGMVGSILLREGNRLRHGGAPSLPETYNQAIDGIEIGPEVGSCGTAAFTGEPVFVSDIDSDPLWADFRELAAQHGLRACWSTPIRSVQGDVLGTFAMYYRERRAPTPHDLEIVGFVTRTAALVIERMRAQSTIRESEQRFRNMADHAPVMMWVTEPDGQCSYLNRYWYEFTGQCPADAEGMGWLDAVHPDDRGWSGDTFLKANTEKQPFRLEYRLRRADGVYRWAIDAGSPRFDQNRNFLGFIGSVIDISERHEMEDALRAGEQRYRGLVQAIGRVVWSTRADGTVVDMPDWREITGQTREEVAGHGWLDALHPDDRETTKVAWAAALSSKAPLDVNYRIRLAEGGYRWVNSRGVPLIRPDGEIDEWVGVCIDIDSQKAAEEATRIKAAEFEALAENVTQLAWMAEANGSIFWYNKRWYEYTGTSQDSQGGWGWESVHDPAALPAVVERWSHSLSTGEPFEMTFPLRGADGVFRPFLTRAVPIRDDEGAVVRWFGTNTDITAQLEAEELLREQGRTLATLNRIGADLAGDLDLESVVQKVTDAGVELVGADFGAFFYNVVNQDGEAYTLFTLSGAERSQFENFGMPRNTAVFGPTFEGSAVVRSDDITKDPRYGHNAPHHGMPKGHLPVRSYLAVPVRSRAGDVIGGLFFGHSEPGRFSQIHEDLMTGLAAQAAIGMDNAYLYRAAQSEIRERVRAEKALTTLNESLEARVEEEIARRTQAEEALRQSQKMETLGQLTGGIAHDFNNLLQVITGNLDIIQRNLPEESPRLKRSAENAAKGADRAAVLTQRLLAFSRRQPLAPKVIDPNKLVTSMSEMLYRSLGETVELETVLASGLWRVEVDPNQLESAILNLAVNSRDAMDDSGKLTIETANAHLDHAYASQQGDLVPGQYVVICVSDTGSGMDPVTAERAVDPFFTTKEVGKGTGLGLSMVYGFVKQSGGHLKIYSEPGQGTTVKIYLPRHYGSEESPAEGGWDEPIPNGSDHETILVCEDDNDVRAYSVETLEDLGYRVIEAADGATALRLLENGAKVDLLFTDIVLPGGMTGAMVADRARAVRPDLKVLFTTGYARDAIVHHGRLDPGVELLSKPFAQADLARRIRELLDAK